MCTYLAGQRGNILDFSQRLEIAIDVAHGLTYLHLYAGEFSRYYFALIHGKFAKNYNSLKFSA